MAGLVFNKKIPALMKGYPTVSDKYNVRGATLAGDSEPVEFGDVVIWTDEGYCTAATTITDETKVAGIVLATNVKVAWEKDGTVLTYPGEAFNLLLDGGVAVELDEEAVEENITIGAPVYLTETGKFTTIENIEFPATFTGVYEKVEGHFIAEIEVYRR